MYNKYEDIVGDKVIKYSKEALKPCPFCGSDALLYDRSFEPDCRRSKMTVYFINCLDCGSSIRTADADRCVQRWNSRAVIKEPVAAVEEEYEMAV